MKSFPLIQLKKEEFKNEDTILRKPSKEVNDFGDSFQKIVDELIKKLKNEKIAIGLAAPQIGIPIKLSVINLNEGKVEPTLVLVNPKIVSTSGKKNKGKESCMSVPHFRGEVERRDKISITFQDRFGIPQTINAKGFLARVIAHEIDHLEGFLYIDRMKDLSQLEPVEFFKK